jgi:hypothetical protein
MVITPYDPAMAMDPSARAPDPGALAQYTASYTDADFLGRTDPLTMLRLGQATRAALSSYDEECVWAARKAGATWQEIGDALGMERQNAQRKFAHLSARDDAE